MTITEIKNYLDENKLNAENTNGFDNYQDKDKKEILNKLGKREYVQQIGGNEGGGESVSWVIHFIEHNVYIKCTGYYYSYDGTTWEDEITEVFPKKKIITVYEE